MVEEKMFFLRHIRDNINHGQIIEVNRNPLSTSNVNDLFRFWTIGYTFYDHGTWQLVHDIVTLFPIGWTFLAK